MLYVLKKINIRYFFLSFFLTFHYLSLPLFRGKYFEILLYNYFNTIAEVFISPDPFGSSMVCFPNTFSKLIWSSSGFSKPPVAYTFGIYFLYPIPLAMNELWDSVDQLKVLIKLYELFIKTLTFFGDHPLKDRFVFSVHSGWKRGDWRGLYQEGGQDRGSQADASEDQEPQ